MCNLCVCGPPLSHSDPWISICRAFRRARRSPKRNPNAASSRHGRQPPMSIHSHIFVPNERQKQKQLKALQQKLSQFDYRARKELGRAIKIVRGWHSSAPASSSKIKKDGRDRTQPSRLLQRPRRCLLVLWSINLVIELGIDPAIVLAQDQDDTSVPSSQSGAQNLLPL